MVVLFLLRGMVDMMEMYRGNLGNRRCQCRKDAIWLVLAHVLEYKVKAFFVYKKINLHLFSPINPLCTAKVSFGVPHLVLGRDKLNQSSKNKSANNHGNGAVLCRLQIALRPHSHIKVQTTIPPENEKVALPGPLKALPPVALLLPGFNQSAKPALIAL